MRAFELALVDWLTERSVHRAPVIVGIGDDMAAVGWTQGSVLLSSDMLLDGVHFDSRRHRFTEIGRKAVACCLSDCAAMAVRPTALLLSLALAKTDTLENVQALLSAAVALANEFDTPLVGGDTTRWGHPLAIDVSVAAAPYDGIEPVRRSGARPGDRLYVTGVLGGSLLGRHLSFTPRIHEARQLASALGDRLHAMIDISDGLALDLWRICQASHVGAVIEEELLRRITSEDAAKLAEEDGRPVLDHVLGDGEDFELLLAVEGRPDDAGVPLHSVGRITEADLRIRRLDGAVEPLEPTGFTH